jgi:hypothetical protein
MKTGLRKFLRAFRTWFLHDIQATTQDSQFLLGRMASWRVRSMEVISSLQDVEFRVTSQWGEDGVIDWLIERANIPTTAHSFVEFGVETYREANTRFLMQNRNWRGLIMDGSPAMVDAVKADGLYWKYDLTAQPAFITRENINALIADAGFSGDIGLLSIDIDGNDYWVWEAIETIRPIIVICEYNAIFGDIHPMSTPYDPAFESGRAHFSRLYHGTSVEALRVLATRKGYRFVGTTTAGNDAFFVREDYARNFVDKSLLHITAWPSTARAARDITGQLSYTGGLDRLRLISGMPVINTVTGETVNIDTLGTMYSDMWLATMTGLAVAETSQSHHSSQPSIS